MSSSTAALLACAFLLGLYFVEFATMLRRVLRRKNAGTKGASTPSAQQPQYTKSLSMIWAAPDRGYEPVYELEIRQEYNSHGLFEAELRARASDENDGLVHLSTYVMQRLSYIKARLRVACIEGQVTSLDYAEGRGTLARDFYVRALENGDDTLHGIVADVAETLDFKLGDNGMYVRSIRFRGDDGLHYYEGLEFQVPLSPALLLALITQPIVDQSL